MPKVKEKHAIKELSISRQTLEPLTLGAYFQTIGQNELCTDGNKKPPVLTKEQATVYLNCFLK